MYLIGADHRRMTESRQSLEQLAYAGQRFVTDAEVFQEMLHRYLAIRRPEYVERSFETLRSLVDEVLSIEEDDVFQAKNIAATHVSLSARDALHVAVMRHHEIGQILSFDRGFDAVAGLERLPRSV